MGEAHRKAQEAREGRQRLVAWLEQAKEDAREVLKAEYGTPLGRAQSSYLSYDKLDMVLIYPAPKGGWHADVVLKDMPPGIPNSIGTRVETPCKTREEAEMAGRGILAGIVAQIEQNGKQEPLPPVFLLHGWKFPLIPGFFMFALRAMPAGFNGYGSPLQAAVRIEQALGELCPRGFDGHEFNGWSQDKKAELLSVLHIAVLSGLFCYPMRKDGEPK